MINKDSRRDFPKLLTLLSFLAAGLAIVAFGAPGPVLAAVLWSLAALGGGFVVGFLFAIPRATELTANSRLKVNNNLVEVSDWLTKIIVGLGLIHLSRAPVYLREAGAYVGEGLKPATAGGGPAPAQFAVGLILYFALLGFMAGYLITRLCLGPAFREADEDTATPSEIQTLMDSAGETDTGERKTLAAGPKAIAQRLAAQPLSEVPDEAERLAAWGCAKVDEGRFTDAIEAYRRALSLSPESPHFHYLLALALKYAGKPQSDVMRELEEARRLVAKGLEPEIRDRIYISYTFNALFLPPPEGFKLAREAALEYLQNPGAQTPPEILINLACAYGQEHASRAGDATAQAELRGKALQAAREVLDIDSSRKPRLRQLLSNDDLASFKDDLDFKKLLGLN